MEHQQYESYPVDLEYVVRATELRALFSINWLQVSWT